MRYSSEAVSSSSRPLSFPEPLGDIKAHTMSPLTRKNKSCAGFTMVELVVVLVIISLVAAVVVPRISAGWRRMEDREFLQDFVQTLKRGRLIAMNSGQLIAFRIRPSERLYDIENPPRRLIPENVDIYADRLESDPETHDRLVVFYPDGSLSGGDLEVVFDKQRSFLIAIHPLVGSIRVGRAQR
jgi:general secretion pathway protein H